MCPCIKAWRKRCMPQPGQLSPVTAWNRHLGAIAVSVGLKKYRNDSIITTVATILSFMSGFLIQKMSYMFDIACVILVNPNIAKYIKLKTKPMPSKMDAMRFNVLAVFEASWACSMPVSPDSRNLLTSLDFTSAIIDNTKLMMPEHEQQKKMDITKLMIDHVLWSLGCSVNMFWAYAILNKLNDDTFSQLQQWSNHACPRWCHTECHAACRRAS